MSYFDDASLVMIPSGTKTSKVYSVKPIDGTGDLTFSRSNDTATRVASNGLIERVRTNLALQSQTFDNASWVKAFATITANATTAPDGTLTADKLIANIGYDPVSATGNLRQTNIVATNTHTISLYAKAAEFTSIRFRENFIVGAFLTIDLTNGSITGAGSQYINPTATAVGDGWYRISFVTPATADLDKYSIRVANTGDGTSGVFIWGFQYEVSDFGPTDYIATTAAAVSVGPVANVPRLDYFGSSCPRLLLEPQRTNLALYSESFDNAGWTKFNASVTANDAVSPDGYTNADALVGDGTNSYHYLINTFASAASGTAYTASFFAKKGSVNFVQLVLDSSSFGVLHQNFDLLNGTIGSGSGSITPFIESYGNDWYRVGITATATASVAIKPYIALASSDSMGRFASFATSGDIKIYGYQVEAGSYVSSYIGPTLGAAVTRGADVASKTGISSLIGQTEGTLFVDFVWRGRPATLSDNAIFSIGVQEYGTSNIAISNYNAALYARVTNGVSVDAGITFGTMTAGTRYKAAIAYANNDVVFYVNGASYGSDTSVSIPAVSNVNLQNSFTNAKDINQALLFKTRLTNAQLAELTTL